MLQTTSKHMGVPSRENVQHLWLPNYDTHSVHVPEQLGHASALLLNLVVTVHHTTQPAAVDTWLVRRLTTQMMYCPAGIVTLQGYLGPVVSTKLP